MAIKQQFSDIPTWPDTTPAPHPAHIGHNRPPPDDAARADFNEAIDAKDGFRQRIVDLVVAADRAVCTNDDEAGRCGDYLRQIREAEKFIDETHRNVKAPYLEAGRAVDGEKNVLMGSVQEAKRLVQRKLDTYVAQQEQKRKDAERQLREAEAIRQREEEERLRAAGVSEETIEAIVEEAVVNVPTHTKIVGTYSSVGSRKEWTHEILDYHTVLLEVADNAKVRDAVELVVKAMIRSGTREIKGVRIFQQTKAGVR
jgi:hypothetical protein